MTDFGRILAAMDALHPEADHDAHRAAHARGILLAGRFKPSGEAGRLCRAAHFREPVDVTVRFSNGSGDHAAPDAERTEGRGMAVKFYAPDGTRSDIVALTLPVFFVRTAADFLALLEARRPGPDGQPDMAAVGAFLGDHPETAQALQAILPTFTLPLSYATRAYNSLHAYRLLDAVGVETAGRYRLVPEAGEHDHPGETPADDYLQAEIRERIAREPVAFRLVLRVAAPGDSLDDPTAAWPEDRETVELGRLELDRIDDTRERGGDVLVFDPTRVIDGIELTDDEILRTRPEVYALSVQRRSGAVRA